MQKGEIARFLILRTIGNFLVLFALYGVIATFGPALYFEVRFRWQEWQGVKYTVAAMDTLRQGNLLGRLEHQSPSIIISGNKEQELIPIDTVFSIVIPKIDANSRIIENVDASSPKAYLPALKKGVAQAAGSATPNEKGTTYLFAHSTDNFWDVGQYNAVFYLLKNLELGDSVVLFYQNKRYDYKVTDKKIVDPTEVGYIVNSKKTDTQVILQTCWPPGTTWKRLLVIAKPS